MVRLDRYEGMLLLFGIVLVVLLAWSIVRLA
jgi:hypothetical protein